LVKPAQIAGPAQVTQKSRPSIDLDIDIVAEAGLPATGHVGVDDLGAGKGRRKLIWVD
jgi:hypothetical protein